MNREATGQSFISRLSQGASRTIKPWERVLWLLVLVLSLFSLYDIHEKYNRISGLYNELEDIEEQLISNSHEHQRLLLDLEFRRSDAYVERYAREELGWLREGDIFFIFP